MLQLIRKKRLFKVISVFLAFNLLAELILPNCAFALTSGPGQPESQSFEPVGTSEMVDLFTGDFNYNIPLMDVDGYPINISYHSGIGMDNEASWVGLGWNINPGAVTREMRGVPDDFNGDQITKKFNMKPNRTYQVTAGIGGEVYGNKNVTAGYRLGLSYNNYTGVGFQQTLNASYSLGRTGVGSLTGGLGVTSGSDGLTLTPSLSYSSKVDRNEKSNQSIGGFVGASFNSRAGLQKLTMGANASYSYAHGSYASSLTFGTPSYIPQVTMPMVSSSVLLSFATGVTLFGVDMTADLSGSYAEQRLQQTSLIVPAYGYLNNDVGSLNPNGILDFNREKDGAYTMNTTNLPLTSSTYDTYSVAGQGISGTYRPYRGDFGQVFDTRAVNSSNSISLGLDLSSGNLVKAGVDVSVNNVITQSGSWSSNNVAAPALAFTSSDAAVPTYERYYFKQAGEKSVDPETIDPTPTTNLLASVGNFNPMRINLEDAGGTEIVAKSQLIGDDASTVTLATSTNHRLARQKRDQAMTLLTKAEAATFGIQKDIYDGTNATMPLSSSAKPHHIAEITTVKSDGSRYVFGLPAYNTKQVDVVFNASGKTPTNGLITYNTGENTTSNSLGIDNYFSSTELPAYAHSYLLTAVLSPDYVDYDGVVGPSEGDLGTYTKFNYVKNNNSDYKWRVPIGNKSANFNEGLKSDQYDNQANYLWGTKEVWYLQSIETKNYIATFTTLDRNDACGVTSEDGVAGSDATSTLKRLDNIKLTSRKDPATILKQVNFVYDYSLCAGTPNNKVPADPLGSGKLTLKSIYFTYGTSNKARLSPYSFTYNTSNPAYNLKGYDRWGNYKPIDANLPNSEFPYTNQIQSTSTQTQDQTNADANVAAWSLRTITLPSGGTITVDYESDDYAYVQDKKAMQMFNVVGIDGGAGKTSGNNPPTSYMLMDAHPGNGVKSTLYFKLSNTITGTQSDGNSIIANDYLGGITDLYFRFMVNMTNVVKNYEYVSGYATITGSGVVTGAGSTYTYGWIDISTVKTGDIGASVYTNTDVSPISRAAWQFGRLYTPRMVWDEPDPTGTDAKSILTAMAKSSFFKNILQLFEGANGSLMVKNYGKETVLSKSRIRLLNPLMKKFGGGLRVKKITTSDAWNTMVSGQPEALYGQEYTYTTTDETTGKTISSGVASYEPIIGGDENSFRKPKYYGTDKAKLLVPSNEHYMEEPFGESFFPAPIVGYSKVTVVQKSPLTASLNVTRHSTGKVVHEFYTAKDFPIITKQTAIDSKPKKQGPIGFLMQSYAVDYVTASQGYVIELNDMHGKPKAQSVYAEGQAIPISQVNYYYRTNPANPKQLANDVTVIEKDGQISNAVNCGVDFDFAVDMREQKTDNSTFGVQGNIAAMVFGLFPVIVPTALPSSVEEYTRFRSASTTKVINRCGILEKTVAQDLGSTVATENLAFDAETGELLATKTINSFEDPVYSFTYPAHWAYTGMSQACNNVGFSATATVSTVSNVSTATVTNASTIFVKGDEVLCTPSTGTALKAWIHNVSGNVITLIDQAGNGTAAGTYTIKIIRSGRRNQQEINVGTFTSRLNPLLDYTVPTAPVAKTYINQPTASFREVLSAGASEFSDIHKMLSTSFTGNPDWTDGAYPNTSESADIKNMLNSLASNGKLLVNGTNLFTNPSSYYYGFTSLLKSNPTLSPLSTVNWYYVLSGPTNNILTGTINSSSSGGCTITLTLPTSYSWANVVGFRNIIGLGNSSYNFNIDVIINSGGTFIVVPILNQTNSCFLMSQPPCNPCPGSSCSTPSIINPYYQGIRGNWRPLKSYVYLADRTQTAGTNNTVDPRKDGSFLTYNTSGVSVPFQPFWNTNGTNDWIKDATYWTYTSQATKFNPLGTEVENMDALQRYSSSLFGYNYSLPLAVASNSKYNQVAFDGFEDYNYDGYYGLGCNSGHFNYRYSYDGIKAYRTSTQAHSGIYSMKLIAGSSIVTSRPVTSVAPGTGADNTPYTIKGVDDMGVFSPDTYNGNKKYVLSVWVREDVITPVTTYSNTGVSISVGGTTIIPSVTAKSDIIDGWQKQELTFTITGGSTGNILVYLINTGTQAAYFDDIRIHPFDGNMKSFVYNPNTLRLMAELDNNNYATFYEYDEEGALVRVKKETQSGIATVKESKSSKLKR